jgi:hypothetical protein
MRGVIVALRWPLPASPSWYRTANFGAGEGRGHVEGRAQVMHTLDPPGSDRCRCKSGRNGTGYAAPNEDLDER